MKDYLEMAESVFARRDRYRQERRRRLRRWTAAAACLSLAALAGVGIWRMDMATQSDGGINVEQADDRDGAGYEQFGTESLPDGGEEQGESDPAVDAPVQDGAEDVPSGTGFDALWGGCYLDGNGKWVVWLTENTPENQTAVFERNPELLESSTVFRTADYSLAYLTELLARISAEMRDGKLPFVTSAAVMEDRNRVEVTLAADDAASVEQVLAFDTLGGAIELASGSAPARGDVLRQPSAE